MITRSALLFLLLSFTCYATVFDTFRYPGGDDAGNGGFTYKQSRLLMEMAAQALAPLIQNSNHPIFETFPERKALLQQILDYENIDERPMASGERNGHPLMFDYQVSPAKVIVYKDYYIAFAATSDDEFPIKIPEVQKRLLHEASHIWGYNEKESAQFAKEFLDPRYKSTVRHPLNIKNDCICRQKQNIGFGNCLSFCEAAPYDDRPFLYADVELSLEDLFNHEVANLSNWCNKELAPSERAPQCFLSVTNLSNIVHLPVTITPYHDKIRVDLSGLLFNQTYIGTLFQIIEPEAHSQSFQFQMRPNSDAHQCEESHDCPSSSVKVCKKIITGQLQNGEVSCALRCFNEERENDCIENICKKPHIPIPHFDPSNPDCSDAVWPE